MLIILLFSFLLCSFQISCLHKAKQNEFSNWHFGSKSPQTGPLAENIKCKNDVEDNEEYFGAVITLPPGFGTVPVFHEASHINPSASEECLMKQMISGGTKFSMVIANFKTCGVQLQKANDGAQWMSVTIRFPFVGGLRMAEDEYITIMCKPQDRTVTKHHAIELKSTVFNPPKTIFSSAPLDFDCSLQLFLKNEDDNTFSRSLPADGVIEMGSEMQLRGSVRQGDGWRFAMLKDVVVHKVSSGGSSMLEPAEKKGSMSTTSMLSQLSINENDSFQKTNSINGQLNKKSSAHRYGRSVHKRESRTVPEAAFLVFSDGCRNPAFRNVAPQHPHQDTTNNLEVNFNFKAFMFQDMEEGDSIRITAKIIACVDQHECQPTRCVDDNQYGYGKRRKRSIKESSNNTSDFSRNLLFKVVAPGFGSTIIKAESEEIEDTGEDIFIRKHSFDRRCRNVIYLIGSLAVFFSLCLTTAASIIVLKSRNKK